MTHYHATINTPGYLPWSDAVTIFDTPQEAWEYLANERMRAEDDAPVLLDDDGETTYSETYQELSGWAVAPQDGFPFADWTGTVYGDTPGYGGDHDLGIAYSVTACDIDCIDEWV